MHRRSSIGFVIYGLLPGDRGRDKREPRNEVTQQLVTEGRCLKENERPGLTPEVDL